MMHEDVIGVSVFNMSSRAAELIWLWMKSSELMKRVGVDFRRSGSETKRSRFQTRSV